MNQGTNPTNGNFNAVVLTLLAVLLVVVAVQGVLLFKMSKANGASGTTNPLTALDEKSRSQDSDAIDDLFDDLNPDWDPVEEMERMRDRIDSAFNQSFDRVRSVPGFDDAWFSSSFVPEADMEETDEAYLIRVDLPGTDGSKVDVKVEDRTLTFKGASETVNESEDGDSRVRRERRLGSFQRSFTLPGPVDALGMTTNYENGVLTITIPKCSNEAAMSGGVL